MSNYLPNEDSSSTFLSKDENFLMEEKICWNFRNFCALQTLTGIGFQRNKFSQAVFSLGAVFIRSNFPGVIFTEPYISCAYKLYYHISTILSNTKYQLSNIKSIIKYLHNKMLKKKVPNYKYFKTIQKHF